jgi:class 3 adenylate cyclase/tetratricopeptide (TPR) repeat protein
MGGMTETMVGVDLSPYVPRVATAWASETPEARSKTVHGSLVFADISGFTALSERLAKRGPIGAEELTEVLGQCFAGLLAVAYAEGGSLVKFGGDALLLLFDGPAHEVRACRAALGMRSSIRTLGRLRTSVGNVRLRMSQGVHSGDIDLYRVGDSHDELIICGPAASDVIRMESAAGAGEIIVSAATARALRTALPALIGGGGDAEHRNVAIAFVHFDGTDRLRERAGVDAVADALDELVRVSQSAAEAEGVTFLATDIDKDGGKIILVSGTPTAHEDAEGRLLRVVRRIADARTTLPVRIGVNRGHVFAGSVGPPYRRTYTVMGDAVNLSARLMAKAAQGEIVVHPSVLELSRTAFATTAMDPFHVKGKAAPIDAVILGDAIGTQEVAATGRTRLVGRDEEMTMLRAWLTETQGSLVDIRGEAGTGKTRLLREIATEATAPCWIVSCERYERSTAYFAVGLLLRHVLGLPRQATASDIVARVTAADPQLEPWAPLVGDVLDVPVDDTDTTRSLEPKYRPQHTATVVTALLDRSVPPGAVLGIDDAQWLDDASRAVLRRVVASIEDRHFCVVTTTRGDQATFVQTGGHHITLGALDDAASAALVVAAGEALGAEPMRPETVAAIVERADGTPLFIEELVRVATRTGSPDLPDSIEGLIATQIDALPPHSRRLLRYAAALGESFEPSVFAEVVADPALCDARAISARVDGLVDALRDGRAAFRHRLVREVAYRTLPFRVRRDVHARAAYVLERATADDAHRAGVLSMHCFHAEQYEKCWAYARVAGEHAYRMYALTEARELYERALAAAKHFDCPTGPLLETMTNLARIYNLSDHLDEAQQLTTRARRLVEDSPADLAEMYLLHAKISTLMGRATAAMRWVRRGLRLLDEIDEPHLGLKARLEVMFANLRLRDGRRNDAVDWATRAVADAREAGDKHALGEAYWVLHSACVGSASSTPGTDAERALAIFEELGQDENVALLLLNLGAAAYFRGRWDEALDYYERSRLKFVRVGSLVDAGLGACNIAEIFAEQGRLDEARRQLEETIAVWRSLRFTTGVALGTRYLGRVSLRSGDVQSALEAFQEAREVFAANGLGQKVIEVETWIAECHIRLGNLGDARVLLSSALAHELSTGSLEMRAMIHRLRSCLAAIDGDIESAWAAADESLAAARSVDAPHDIAAAIELIAGLCGAFRRPVDPGLLREREALLVQLGVVMPPPALPLPASP